MCQRLPYTLEDSFPLTTPQSTKSGGWQKGCAKSSLGPTEFANTLCSMLLNLSFVIA